MIAVFKNAYDAYQKGKELNLPALSRWAVAFAASLLVLLLMACVVSAMLVEARGFGFTIGVAVIAGFAYSLQKFAAQEANVILAQAALDKRTRDLGDILDRMLTRGDDPTGDDPAAYRDKSGNVN